MAELERLPAVLEVVAEPPLGQPCMCICGARHPGRKGVCAGVISVRGVRVRLNSLNDVDGVPLCRPCADAWPDIPQSRVRRLTRRALRWLGL